MANIKHLVIVMMENRSFDEYFGTFPGVSGFFDQSPAFAQPWEISQPFPPSPLYPWRTSTFTTNAADTPGGAHQWNSMHQAVNPQLAISGLNYPQGANNMGFYIAQGWGQPWSQSGAVMGYYVADDIPYHWALAANFALCDQYFCSVLSGTGPNRMYAVGGTILPADPSNPAMVASPPPGNIYSVGDTYPPVLNNVGAGALGVVGSADPDGVQPGIPDPPFDCPNYLTALYNAAMQNPMETDSPTYRVYDDWNWAWGGAEATGAEGVYPDLNVFYYYQPVNGVQLGAGAVPGSSTADPHYFAANDTAQGAPGDTRPLFAQHINPDPQFPSEGPPVLAKVTWIFPPWNYCEHPSNASNWKSADGARYLSQIVDALIASEFWEDTVLVVTYDESNNNFDHVTPPFPTPEQEPWVNAQGSFPLGYAAPIGAGMRVPAIIVSPWTYGAGVIHTQMDHTSLLQLVETLFEPTIPCPALPPLPGWRRSTFANLGDVITGLGTDPVSATTIQADRSSPTGLPTSETAQQWQANAQARYNVQINNAPQAPVPQGWPAVPQACAFTNVQSYTRAQIGSSDSSVTFANALSIAVTGFEAQEFIDPNAGVPGPAPYPGMLQAVPISGTSSPLYITRIPSVIAVGRDDITFACTGISGDPNALAAMQPSSQGGIPTPLGFTFNVTFQNPADTFAGIGPAIFLTELDLQAWFTVDTTVTADGSLYLTRGSFPPWIFTKITEFGNILGSGGGIVIDVLSGDPLAVLRGYSVELRREVIHIINQIDLDASDAIDQFGALVRDAFDRHPLRKAEG
jgi:phospholipase C